MFHFKSWTQPNMESHNADEDWYSLHHCTARSGFYHLKKSEFKELSGML